LSHALLHIVVTDSLVITKMLHVK